MSTSGNNGGEDPTRKGKGRRKVAMEKMENESNLQVTFSKRRNGLFKKASELSTRCGAETALVVFSPAGKPYSFGHPNVETVTSRFLGRNDQNPPPTAVQLIASEAERNMIANATTELNQAVDQLDLAKNQAKELEHVSKQLAKMTQMKESNYEQLDQLKAEVFGLKNKLNGTGEAKEPSFTGGPYTFLETNPNLGTSTKFQPVEPQPTGSTFDPPMGSNLQGLSSQFPNFYGSGGLNVFNVPSASYDPRFAGTSTSTNFLATPGYIPMPGNASSSFVVPYTPLATHPAATNPINYAENEPRDDAGDARKDGDEY